MQIPQVPLENWKRDECNEVFVPKAHVSSMASNQQEHASFCILWSCWSVYKNISSTGVVDHCISLHFHISISQPEFSMEVIIKQSLSLMWFNKVPLRNNNAEDSEGVLHQPILSVWSLLFTVRHPKEFWTTGLKLLLVWNMLVQFHRSLGRKIFV